MIAQHRIGPTIVAAVLLCATSVTADAQPSDSPQLRATPLTGNITIDGLLNEAAWKSAERAENFLQADPAEGAPATARTIVRVLANAKAIVVGIVCEDPEPARIVSFSVRRDAPLKSEDHVRIVFGPFRRPIGIRVRRQSQRCPVRRADQSGRRERQPGLGRYLGGRDGPDCNRLERRDADSRADPELQARSARVALQRAASDSAPARDGPMGVARAPVQDHADQPGGAADRTAGFRSWARTDRATGGDHAVAAYRRRHARVDGEFQPSLDVTQRLGANVLASARSTPTSPRPKSTRGGRT